MKINEIFHHADVKQSVGLDVDELKSVLTKNCSQNIKEMAQTKKYIYRGEVSEDALFYSTWLGGQSGRVSRNTTNYYTLFMDNLDEWNAYPKRNESMICTARVFDYMSSQ